MVMSVILNPAEGWAQIGPLKVTIRLTGHNGALQINGDLGPCLCPIYFMERTRITTYATVSNKPSQAMAKLVAEASFLSIKQNTSKADPVVVAIIALVLAGANETNMPSFAESALLVSQQSGWTPEQLGQSNAADIDKLAQQLLPEVDDGWIRLKLNTSEETDLNLIQNELANNLLVRLQSNHDMLHTATPIEKSSPNPISDTFPSLLELSDQQAHIANANNTSSLMDVSKSQKPKSPEFSTSTVEAARSSSPSGTKKGEDVSTTTSLTKSSNYTTRSVPFSQNSQSVGEQPIPMAKASPVLPISVKNNQYTSTKQYSLNITEAIPAPERLRSSISSSLTDTSYKHEQDNVTDEFAHIDSIIPKNMPLQTQISPKIITHKEIELDDFLDEFAARLHLEADLRGIDR